MADFDNKIDFDTKEAVKDIDQLARSMREAETAGKGMGQGAKVASRDLDDVKAKSRAAGRQVGGMINEVTELAFGFSSLSPEIRRVTTGLAGAGNTAMQMGASMGPLGAAVGFLIGVLPTFVTELLGTEQQTDATRQAAEGLTGALLDQVDAIVAAEQAFLRFQRIKAGEEDVATQRAALTAAQNELTEAQAQLDRLRTEQVGQAIRGAIDELPAVLQGVEDFGDVLALGTAEGIERALVPRLEAAEARVEAMATQVEQRQQALATAQARALEEEAKELAELEAGKFDTGGGRGGGGRRASSREQHAAQRALKDLLEMQAEQAEREARAEADALAAVKAKNIELERAAEARERELFAMEMQGRAALKLKQLEEERAEAATQAEKKLGQVNREQEEHQAKLRSLIGRTEEGMSGVVDIAAEAFRIQKESNQSFAESFKTAIDAWLSSFAIQEAYKAAAALAEAIGNTVMNQPHAAAKYAEFAQHAALAAAAGGAAAAIPSGGSSASAQPTASAPAGGGGGEGGGTVVINYNAPVAEEELGRHQARHERAAQRRYGRVQR